jgi:hypothetical protein
MNGSWSFGTKAAIAALIASGMVTVAAPVARAGDPSGPGAPVALLQQRLDQARKPAPAPAGRIENSGPATPTGASAGSFPHSFLIPGTDTSVSVGGDIAVTFGHRTSEGFR